MLNKYHFNGKLTLKNTNKDLVYCIVQKTENGLINNNLADILYSIYISKNPYVSIHINNKQAEGELYRDQDQYGVYDWFVEDFPLGLDLFNNTNKELDIAIKHLEEKEIKKKALEATS
jgi:hypothetical protein